MKTGASSRDLPSLLTLIANWKERELRICMFIHQSIFSLFLSSLAQNLHSICIGNVRDVNGNVHCCSKAKCKIERAGGGEGELNYVKRIPVEQRMGVRVNGGQIRARFRRIDSLI